MSGCSCSSRRSDLTSLRDDLDATLADGREFEVHYQPIVAIADGHILAVEALVRWRHPRRGYIAADAFVPLAEKSLRIVRLGQHVLERSCRQLAAWRAEVSDAVPYGILVNVSPRELTQAGYLRFLDATLAANSLVPTDIGIELTERVFIDERKTLVNNVAGLGARGHRLVLDDFGTGYSALSSLQRFPFSALKIDRFFIGSIESPDDEAPIVRAIVALGHTLGLLVIAEGVETPTQLTYLRRLGCDAAQGFLLGRPQPAGGITPLLVARPEAEESPERNDHPRRWRRARAVPSSGMAPIPTDDAERVAALHSYGVLEAGPQRQFDELARLAAEICQVPMAFVSLVESDREFFLSAVGSELTESPRDVSFCGHTIVQDEDVFVIPDALQDRRFAQNPNVLGGPQVRFYAGVPLVMRDGYALGALCVKDIVPRTLSERQLEGLRVLGGQVVAQLELKRQLAESRADAASARLLAERLHSVSTSYDLLFDSVASGVLSVDGEGRITHANPVARRELGYSEQELVGAEAHAFLQHSQADGVPSQAEKSLFAVQRPDSDFEEGAVLWRKDGSFFEVAATLLPVIEGGRSVGGVLLFQNVSARKSAERELRSNRALYRTLVESSPDLIGLISLDGTIRFASRSHTAAIGYAPGELVGNSVGKLVDPASFERAFELVSRGLAGEPIPPLRTRMRCKDGSFLPIEISFAIVYEDTASEPLVLTTSRDLTRMVELEMQFQQAQKLEPVGQLTAAVAHDFNNLLLSMPVYADLAREKIGDDQPELRRMIDQMHEVVEGAGALVDQLLTASRNEPHTPKLLSLDEAVATALPLIQTLLGASVELTHIPCAKPPCCICDPGSLNQALLNLAANSRDALAGHGHVTIETGHRALAAIEAEAIGLRPGKSVTLAFSDDGSGMATDTQAHIFEPFFSTKAEHGTGLGLATVASIVREAAGAIEIESAPGRGSKFTITLPAAG